MKKVPFPGTRRPSPLGDTGLAKAPAGIPIIRGNQAEIDPGVAARVLASEGRQLQFRDQIRNEVTVTLTLWGRIRLLFVGRLAVVTMIQTEFETGTVRSASQVLNLVHPWVARWRHRRGQGGGISDETTVQARDDDG